MRRILIASIAAGVILSAGFAAGASRAYAADQGQPVILGGVYNRHGEQASLDIPTARGARLAVRELNRKGGVLDRPLRLIAVDGDTKADVLKEKTAQLFERFPSIVALTGLSDTDMVLAAAPVAAAHRRLFLTSGATSPQLPAQIPDYLFLACFGDNVQAAAGAEWAYRDRGARTAAILYDSSSTYTRLLQGYFKARFEALGGQVVSSEAYAGQDLDGPIGHLKKADMVFLSAHTPGDAAVAVARLRAAGFSGLILGGDGFDSETVWRRLPNVSKVFFTTHAYLGADNRALGVVAFRRAYREMFANSEPDAFAALGYDSVRLLASAIERAGRDDPGAVLDALASTRNFKGVTGTFSYADSSHIPTKSVSIVEIRKGKRRLAKEFIPSAVPPP
ncbi:MAG: ABC transporter substrate-binding protein [Alphaproteobacteria bacterium]